MNEMLTARDIQEMLQVDRSTVYRMADDGRLPAIKVGRQWRFPRQAVERFLSSGGRAEPTPADPHKASGISIWPVGCIQLLLDAFAELLDVMLVLTDLDGQPITEVSNPLPYYQLMQETEEGHDLCLKVWGRLGQMHAIEPRLITTFGDLRCARALVRIGNELKGMVIAFGIAPEDWSLRPEIKEEIRGIFNGQKDNTLAAFQTIQPMSIPDQNQVLDTLQQIADILSHITHERSDLVGRLAKISQLSSIAEQD